MKLDRARITIVRLSAIGDCIHGLPVLCALRDALPHAHLSWIVEGRTAGFLCRHPALDQVIQVPRKWLKSPRAVWRLRRELRALKPDVTMDLQGLTKSAIAARISGAKTRVGFDGIDGRELSRWSNNLLVEPQSSHVIDRNLELLRALDLRPRIVRFGLPPFDEEDATIGKFLRECGLASGQFAIINAGSGWASRRWPTERFTEVARYLGETYRMPSVIVWGGNEEQAQAAVIATTAGGHAHVAPPTTLAELAALCRRGQFFLSSDTGPLHLAVAAGTPCIGMYGPVDARRNGPYGRGHIILQRVLLTGSSRARRGADNASMRAITVEDVCAACDQMIRRKDLSGLVHPSSSLFEPQVIAA
jgi:lipopolysaccharide heptosyltransferase I